MNLKPKIEWSQEHEDILVEWADKAACYRWLHDKAHQRMSVINAWFTVPVIILSTLTGTANFAQDRIPVDYRALAVMVIGGLNIIAGIITTISQFLKISEKNEGHRVSAIAWGKFNRNIKIELTKRPLERTEPDVMIKSFKEEYDRLSETSPIILQLIIMMFLDTFSDLEEFDNFAKPEVCNELKSTKDVMFKSNFLDIIKEVPQVKDTLKDTETEIRNTITDNLDGFKNELLNTIGKINEEKEELQNDLETRLRDEEDNLRQLKEDVKTRFIEMHNREPFEDELQEGLEDLMNTINTEEGKQATI
jgi:hypothetical protein